MPILVTVLSKAYVCSRLNARIEGSNSVEYLDVNLLCMWRPLWRVGHSFREVLPDVRVCVCVCVCHIVLYINLKNEMYLVQFAIWLQNMATCLQYMEISNPFPASTAFNPGWRVFYIQSMHLYNK
jgi:hypothetical protein